MNPVTIFGLQFVLSMIVLSTLAVWYVMPRLSSFTATAALTILIFPHSFRHIGLSFLVPNLNSGGLPESFATTAGYGDLATAVLAFVAIAALKWRSFVAVPLVWLFNIIGTADLFNALRQAEAIQYFGPTWFIPTFLVPLLLVTHAMIFLILMKKGTVREGQAP